jgi:hypothetical protein
MTGTDGVTTRGEVIDRYQAAWNEPDPARRAALIEQVWAADGRLTYPLLPAEGHTGIGELVTTLRAQFPDHRVRRASDIDEHHDQFRFAWEAVGLDVGERAADGRLRRITGFVGPLPAGGPANRVRTEVAPKLL